MFREDSGCSLRPVPAYRPQAFPHTRERHQVGRSLVAAYWGKHHNTVGELHIQEIISLGIPLRENGGRDGDLPFGSEKDLWRKTPGKRFK